MRKSLKSRIALVLLWILFFFVLIFPPLKSWHSGGNDFRAYYTAAERFWNGTSPYNVHDNLPYKYAPTTVLILSPLAAMPYETALHVYLILVGILACLSPWVLLRSLSKKSGLLADTPLLLEASVFSLVCSLRFLDNEFSSSQINLFSESCLVLLLLWGLQFHKVRRGLCFALAILLSLFKFHPLCFLVLFSKSSPKKAIVFLVTCAIVYFLLPHYEWWLQLPSHWTQTNQQFPRTGSDKILQGFYPFWGNYFAVLKNHALAFGSFLVVLFFLWRSIPKWDAFAAKEIPLRVFIPALFSVLLLASLSTPLPWQHSFSFIWIYLPSVYVLVEKYHFEKKLLWLTALLIGVTPKGILGRAGLYLEEKQIIFFLLLCLVGIAARISLLENKKGKAA